MTMPTNLHKTELYLHQVWFKPLIAAAAHIQGPTLGLLAALRTSPEVVSQEPRLRYIMPATKLI
jgi:hypothetical protein